MASFTHQLEQLITGSVQVHSTRELKKKLSLGIPLRVKLGVDPTSSDIHLGHTVVLQKLRQFQDLGHHALLIIGDYTAMIGDPSGRSVMRPSLSHEQVLEHAQTYQAQAFKVLDSEKTEIRFNSEWLAPMRFAEVIRLNSRVTLQQILQREDFRNRIDGVQKMSKSLGNFVGVEEDPSSMFGKLMSISDALMHDYYRLLLGATCDDSLHPMEAKRSLAERIVSRYHTTQVAEEARREFDLRFSKRDLEAAELPEYFPTTNQPRDITSLVVEAFQQSFGISKSRSDARRLIEGGECDLVRRKNFRS